MKPIKSKRLVLKVNKRKKAVKRQSVINSDNSQCNSAEPSPTSRPTPRKKSKLLKHNRGSGVNFLLKLKQVRTIKNEVAKEDNNSEKQEGNPPVNFVDLSQTPLFLFSSRTMASKDDSDDECEEKSQGIILHYQGQKYRCDKARDSLRYWRCTRCKLKPARAVSRIENGKNVFGRLTSGVHHQHLDDIKQLKVDYYIHQMYEELETDWISKPGYFISKVWDQMSEDAEACSLIPKHDTLRRMINRYRHEFNEDLNVLDVTKMRIPPDWRRKLIEKDGKRHFIDEQFVRYDSLDTRQSSRRVILMASNKGIELLNEHTTWGSDATFRVTPRLFTQMLVIGVFWKHAFCPCAYALMTERSEEFYTEVLEQLNKIVGKPPKNVLTDFETALKNAFEKTFVGTSIHHCYFHYTQSLLRQFAKMGLKQHTKLEGVMLTLRMCFATALIPKEYVSDAFLQILRQAPKVMHKFLSYFGSNYIGVSIDENKIKKANTEILIITPVYHRRLSTSQNWLENEGPHENKVPTFTHNETNETRTIDDLPEEEKDFSYVLTTKEKKILYKTCKPRFSPNYWNMYQLLKEDQPKATSAIEAQHLELQDYNRMVHPAMTTFLVELNRFDSNKMNYYMQLALNKREPRYKKYIIKDERVRSILSDFLPKIENTEKTKLDLLRFLALEIAQNVASTQTLRNNDSDDDESEDETKPREEKTLKLSAPGPSVQQIALEIPTPRYEPVLPDIFISPWEDLRLDTWDIFENFDRANPHDNVFLKNSGQTIMLHDILTLKDGEWLNNEIIDVLFNLICSEDIEGGHEFTFYPIPTVVMRSFIRNKCKKTFQSWEFPMQEYNNIVLPGFINENHWCLVIANMNSHVISTYDSKSGNHAIKLEYMSQFEKLLRGIAGRIAHPMPAEPFEKRELECAKQKNYVDCGIHCLVNLWSLKNFKLLKEVGHRTFMPYFRRRFVKEIITHFHPNLLDNNAY